MDGREDYTLMARVDYMRRPRMSSLLFSLAQRALVTEANGQDFEQVTCHLTFDGDYMALIVVDVPEGT